MKTFRWSASLLAIGISCIYNYLVNMRNIKLKNFTKFSRLISLWLLVFLFVFVKKNTQLNQENSKEDDKDQVTASQEDQDSNNFLFVDCTGFYE